MILFDEGKSIASGSVLLRAYDEIEVQFKTRVSDYNSSEFVSVRISDFKKVALDRCLQRNTGR